MSENALEKLKWEAREKKLEKKLKFLDESK